MMEYYNTDAFGNTIYVDAETEKLYSFTPEEIAKAEEACSYNPMEALVWDEAHIVTKFYQ